MTASNDAGFSAAWNASSDKFAVASQDGFVSVWDIRSSEKLAKISSKQVKSLLEILSVLNRLYLNRQKTPQNPQVKGAVRCLKFSPSGPIDLLMFSEVSPPLPLALAILFA
jgi:WD40 repeat protein